MKLLMIANSFGVNLQNYAKQIADANEFDLDIYVLYIGGCSLETHYNNIKSDAKAYQLFHNGADTGEMISIKSALEMDTWDVVSLQQASMFSAVLESYEPFLGFVYNYAKELAPNAKIAYHKTWAYSSFNTYMFDFAAKNYDKFKFTTAEEMKAGIDNCFDYIMKNYKIDYVIDSAEVVCLAEKKLSDVHDDWGFHMNELGCYLIGLNLVKLLSKKEITNPVQLAHIGKATCEKAAKFINENF